jgi:hypothetical protein
MSQSVWNYHSEKLIKDWRYVVDIHSPVVSSADVALKNAGLSPCLVKCSYKTVLEQPDIKIGISLGKIARAELWRKMRTASAGDQPAYVHGIHVDTLPEVERRKVSDQIIKLLADKDTEASWRLLYPRISVAVSLSKDKSDIVLAGGEIVSESSSLVRSYALPLTAPLIGEEVTIKINYDSVIPQAMSSFHISFPWLTQGCSLETIVHGETEYFVWESHLVGDPTKEVASEDQGQLNRFVFKSSQLVLPGSRLAVRWQLRKPR